MSESEKVLQGSVIENCCEHFDVTSSAACALCKAPICKNCSEVVENSKICVECYVKVLEEQIEKEASTNDMPLAILGGFLGAILGAALWVAVYVLTHIMIGIAAIGVGYLAGQGVSLFVGRRKAYFLQIISAIFAFLGVFLGYLSVYVYIEVKSHRPNLNGKLDYFDFRIWLEVLKNLPSELGFFSWLFMAISIYYSWQISAPSKEYQTA